MNDLINDPWIPVEYRDGSPGMAGIASCLLDRNILKVSGAPHERASILRLLICILHAAAEGPRTHSEWIGLDQKIDIIIPAYLKKWKERFSLIGGERPFLQMPGIEGTPLSTDILDFAIPSGNNTLLWDLGRKPMNPAHLAVSLLSHQNFCLGGLAPGSGVFLDGEDISIKAGNPKGSSSDGPCSSKSMIHSFITGGSLRDTVWLNAPSIELMAKSSFLRGLPETPFGMPAWEAEPLDCGNSTGTYLGRLAPVSRFIRLVSHGEMIYGPGWRYPSLENDGVIPSTATIVNRKDKPAILSWNPGHAPWRSLGAILAAAGRYSQPPPAMGNLDSSCGLEVMALLREPGKCKVNDAASSLYGFAGMLAEPGMREAYESGIMIAEDAAAALQSAFGRYCQISGGQAPRFPSCVSAFWRRMEGNIGCLLDCISGEKDMDEWLDLSFKTATEEYILQASGQSSRHVKGRVIGINILRARRSQKKEDA